MHVLSAFALAGLALCSPALGGETPWQEVAPGVSIRLISAGKVAADRTALLALEIDMPAGTKTYWRVPGETGLAADFDLSGSRGVQGYEVLWPHPLREEKAGYLDYVYYGHVVLPIEVDVGDVAGAVDVLATLGICSEICVPAQARFALPLVDAQPDMPNELRIRQAVADVPMAWNEGEAPLGGVSLAADGAAIAVELAGAGVDLASLVAATANGEYLFGTPQKSPQGSLVVLPILGKTDNSALEGMEVELTFMTDMGAFSINRTVESGHLADVAVQGR